MVIGLDHVVYDYRGWTTNEIRERVNVFGAYIAATQYSWGANHEPLSLTYPDNVIVSYQYPSPNAALYAPVPLPSEVDISFNQKSTWSRLVSATTQTAESRASNMAVEAH